LKPSLKDFKMSQQYFEEKNIFLLKCLFVFLSKYCVQKYCVCLGPKRDKGKSGRSREIKREAERGE